MSMKIISIVLAALVWFSGGINTAFAVVWHIRKDTDNFIWCTIHAVFCALLGVAWIVEIFTGDML